MADESDRVPILDCVIQMGIIRLRARVGPTRAQASIPRGCMCVEQSSGMVLNMEITEPLESYLPLVLKAVSGAANRLRGLPQQIQLRDPAMAAELRQVLEPTGVEVVVRESLPELDEATESLLDYRGINGSPRPGLLDVKGMTLDHVIGFAEAAEAFARAAPWRHLTDDDLIMIESPAGPPGTQFALVLGAGGQTFGLSFLASRAAFEKLSAGEPFPRGGFWTLLLGDIDSMPFDDGDALERHGLPVASPDAYPSFIRRTVSGSFTYPTPPQLTWAEGLLRAIAMTTEDELDVGRWEKQVGTHAGAATYRFSMPMLLEQMAGKRLGPPGFDMRTAQTAAQSMMRALGQQLSEQNPASLEDANRILQSIMADPPKFEPRTDAERATALCDQAQLARGRRRVQLARQALAIDPDCAEALLLLGIAAGDLAAATPFFRRAVDAARRRLPAELFEQQVGKFWLIHETRPYMRARQELAVALMNQEQYAEAAEHLGDLLRLNTGDNPGNRYHLAQCLLNLNQLDRLDELLNRGMFKDEFSAEWMFTRLLLEYRRHADSPLVLQRLAEAQQVNPHVVPLLTGRTQMPSRSPQMFSPGSVEEAVICVQQLADGWAQTDGALDWLYTVSKPPRRRAQSKRPGAGKKKKPRK